jgi:hypothetical protein
MVVMYCAIARVSRPLHRQPHSCSPSCPGHRQRKQTDKSRGAGSRGDLTGRRQAEGRIHFWLHEILRRPHPHGPRELIEALADSLDFRLVILVA